jgi:hypothetical protein
MCHVRLQTTAGSPLVGGPIVWRISSPLSKDMGNLQPYSRGMWYTVLLQKAFKLFVKSHRIPLIDGAKSIPVRFLLRGKRVQGKEARLPEDGWYTLKNGLFPS